MSEFLTREDIFALPDIDVKEITVPDTITSVAWRGKKFHIKQLNRGQQDTYLKRQFGDTRMKQDSKANQQEISAVNIYGHDTWLCIRGMCKPDGSAMFTDADTAKLNEKAGDAIGWIASQIITFSGMDKDVKVAKGEMSPEEALADDIKN